MNIGIPIASPPWSALGKELESTLRKAIFDFDLIDENTSKIAIALSGGKDSLSLLFLLHALRGRGFASFDLHAIHIDGEFSCGAGVDASFLKGICHQLGVFFHSATSDIRKEDLECYSCSRQRRKLIFQKAKELGISLIAFGHHRDDSAQTLLLNLFHKAEFAANLPKVYMHHYDVTIIRPLIYIQEEDLKTFAKQYGFSRITCQCPVGQNSKRKVIDQLLNEIEIHFPHVRANVAKAGRVYGSKKALTP